MDRFALIFAVVSTATGFLIKTPKTRNYNNVAGETPFAQNFILALFDDICEESRNPLVGQYSRGFSNLSDSNFKIPNLLSDLRRLQSNRGLLPKHEIFSEYNSSHLQELATFYKLLYYADDLETFYRAAAWSRQNLNCGLFIDLIYMALLNRQDTAKIQIPAPYQLLPNYFIRRDVILKASRILDGKVVDMSEDTIYEADRYVLRANYTSDINRDIEDSNIAYFTEDLDVNCYYYFNRIQLLSDFINNSSTDNSSERFFYIMKQLLTRLNLERYSNNLPVLVKSSRELKSLKDYNPLLLYSNGEEFGHRISPLSVEKSFISTLKNMYWNKTKKDFSNMTRKEIVNYMMENLVMQSSSFEYRTNPLLGRNINSQQSVLEHYLTSLRDPIYWRIWKFIIDEIEEALQHTRRNGINEIYLPGIKIVDVECKKMNTFYDNFDFDVTKSLKTNNTNNYFVQISQRRLNHKPFVVKLNMFSQTILTRKALLRIYLGKRNVSNDSEPSEDSFILLDKCEIFIKPGKNKISRSSEEMKYLQKNNLESNSVSSFILYDISSLRNFSPRMILPRGAPEGLPLQLLVFVSPIYDFLPDKNRLESSYSYRNSMLLSSDFPFYFLSSENKFFDLPNVFIKDILITHKDDEFKPMNSYGKSYNDDYQSDARKTMWGKYQKNLEAIQQLNEIDSSKTDDSLFRNKNLSQRNNVKYAEDSYENKMSVSINRSRNDYRTNPSDQYSKSSKQFEMEKNFASDGVRKQLIGHKGDDSGKFQFDLEKKYGKNPFEAKYLAVDSSKLQSKSKSLSKTDLEENNRQRNTLPGLSRTFENSYEDYPPIRYETIGSKKQYPYKSAYDQYSKKYNTQNETGVFEYE